MVRQIFFPYFYKEMWDFTALLSHYKSPHMLCIMIMQTQGNEANQVTQAQMKEQSVLKIHVQCM